MKGLFDTAKKMAVFVRVLLLTFALQCVCGAVGYAQENPTGGDQGAPSCSSGECTSGDSCQCLTTHFLNNDGDEFCADSNSARDDSNEYELEEVTNDEQREELLKRLTEARSKGEQGVNDGAVHYIFVDQYLKTPKEVYEETLETATPGERWLIERMTENYKSLRGGKNEFPTSVNTGIALEQMLPQVIPVYDNTNKVPLIQTMTKLKQLGYVDKIGEHEYYEGLEVKRRWWALELENYTCYYNGFWERFSEPGLSGRPNRFVLAREGTPKHQKLLRLHRCLPTAFMESYSAVQKLENILSINDNSHEADLFAFEFGIGFLPGVGTALIVMDDWEKLGKGDCQSWAHLLGSTAGDIFFIGKATVVLKAWRAAEKAGEVGKAWRITSIAAGTTSIGLVGNHLITKAREDDFGGFEWGELTYLGFELLFLVADIKAEIPKNTRIFKQKVPSSAVGCLEETHVCGYPVGASSTWSPTGLSSKWEPWPVWNFVELERPAPFKKPDKEVLENLPEHIHKRVFIAGKELGYEFTPEHHMDAELFKRVFGEKEGDVNLDSIIKEIEKSLPNASSKKRDKYFDPDESGSYWKLFGFKDKGLVFPRVGKDPLRVKSFTNGRNFELATRHCENLVEQRRKIISEMIKDDELKKQYEKLIEAYNPKEHHWVAIEYNYKKNDSDPIIYHFAYNTETKNIMLHYIKPN